MGWRLKLTSLSEITATDLCGMVTAHSDPAAQRKETFDYDIRIVEDNIEQVEAFKYLGSMTTADRSLGLLGM